ncbi:cytochrome C oxidase subunit IV family protein [Terracidiphilus gabretensis]|jgi:cytochrome c oxidase subunit IV|uniref:cytochrome C oxidase subunit IV family protein n=1 Tax=Terracidiphilus gabretensis TaxID=1577687 RepID=UPI00071C013D|nr:cytochrome C oxidase subunit IV family protein [Terracidiphilus gabretensis]
MSEHHESHAPEGHDDALEGHIVSPVVYIIIFIALLIGTAATIGASYLDLHEWNPIIAIAIAVTKATLVVLFFMHVKYSPKLTKLTVGAGLFTFLVLIFMTLSDYISRAWGRW